MSAAHRGSLWQALCRHAGRSVSQEGKHLGQSFPASGGVRGVLLRHYRQQRSLGLRTLCSLATQELTRKAVLRTRKEKIEELRGTSYWLPQFQPEYKEKIEMVGGRHAATACCDYH